MIVQNYVSHFMDLHLHDNLLYLSYYHFDLLHFNIEENFIFGNGFYWVMVDVITFILSVTFIVICTFFVSVTCSING